METIENDDRKLRELTDEEKAECGRDASLEAVNAARKRSKMAPVSKEEAPYLFATKAEEGA